MNRAGIQEPLPSVPYALLTNQAKKWADYSTRIVDCKGVAKWTINAPVFRFELKRQVADLYEVIPVFGT